MIEALLVDWDGTLVDSRERVLAAYHRATDGVLPRPFPHTADERVLALTTAEAPVCLALMDGDVDAAARLVGRFRVAYLAVDTPVALVPGARILLDGVRQRGVPIAVVTAKARASLACDLAALGATDRFAVTIVGDGGHPPKPDPAPVRAALAALEVAADRALFFGDAPSDVAAGRAAGVRTVGALHGFDPVGLRAAQPDVVVRGPVDVLDLVDGAAAAPVV